MDITQGNAFPATISSNQGPEKVSFENMQLSTQGSERQKKDILKCSLGFEQLVIERKAISRDQNDTEILAELIAKYNSFKANAAIKNWQISPQRQGIERWKTLPLTLNGQNSPSSLYIFTETTPLFRKCVKFQAGIFHCKSS